MADLKILPGTVPSGTAYPATFNDFLKELSSYLTVSFPDELKTAYVGSSKPTGSDQEKLWFKLSQTDNSPVSVNLYIDGEWLEFTQFVFGDMVLIKDSSVIKTPWGQGSTTYTVNGVQKLTPSTPTAPSGFKYKVYVGNYT